jgi:hypothetical protein
MKGSWIILPVALQTRAHWPTHFLFPSVRTTHPRSSRLLPPFTPKFIGDQIAAPSTSFPAPASGSKAAEVG